MPDPEFGKITDEKVRILRQRVGIDLDPENFEPADPVAAAQWRPLYTGFNHEVTPDAIRHFVNGYGDDNPLYCDPEYATKSQWGGLIAPPTFVWTMYTPSYGDDVALGGGDEPPRRLRAELRAHVEGDPIRGTGALQSDLRYEFYRPLRPGDHVFGKQSLIGVADKRSSWGGRAVHTTYGVVTWNDHREPVHLHVGTWVRAERRPVSQVRDVQPGPEPYTEEEIAEIDAAYEAETRRGCLPLFWEDVVEGDDLPTLVKGPYRLTDAILWHAGFGQAFPTHAFRLAYETRKRSPGLFTPNRLNVPDIVQRMHWDEEWAQKVGAATCYDYGALRETFLAQLVTNWMGDDGWLWKMTARHLKFNYVGDTTWIGGKITAKDRQGARCTVHIDLWCRNQRGSVTSTGSAVVLLPSRAWGPVELPVPPETEPNGLLRREAAQLENG
jgi:acyl dehydratase